jgi:trehalose utilization protein
MRSQLIEKNEEAIRALDSLIDEFGETLPINFNKRIRKIAYEYFMGDWMTGVNVYYELCLLARIAQNMLFFNKEDYTYSDEQYTCEDIKHSLIELKKWIVKNNPNSDMI